MHTYKQKMTTSITVDVFEGFDKFAKPVLKETLALSAYKVGEIKLILSFDGKKVYASDRYYVEVFTTTKSLTVDGAKVIAYECFEDLMVLYT